jgi:NAD(P)H-hydrate epimerase
MIRARPITYLSQSVAKQIDVELMGPKYGFSLDQLMELAGLSVSQAVHRVCTHPSSILVCCGPGNNGGDGLVAARHLAMYGHSVSVWYPKMGRNNASLYERLVQQCVGAGVHTNVELSDAYDVLVDALFGFGFSGAVREPFTQAIDLFSSTTKPVVSVDVPSGWDVDQGNLLQTFVPHALVSLTAPKQCAMHFTGRHFLGGRFVPKNMAVEYALHLPEYPDADQITEI